MEFTVSAELTIRHTDTVEAETLEQAWAIVDEWLADDFTENEDCSRSWQIRIS